jgi:WD40 repeat protein/energy-coupling factor transporter ATP-binding protein EcfA2
MAAANETYDVFISYSRLDWRNAADIDGVLRAKGLKPFFDRRDLAPGLPWVRALEQAIGAARAVIVLIGPHGFGNTQQYERELAFFRQSRHPTFPVVPVILPGASTDLPFNFLQVLTWIDFSHVTKVSDAPLELQHLLTAVRGGAVSGEVEREAICPYRGLDPFREEDSAFFFGRGSADNPKSAIGELVVKIREQPFVMVVGRSGSGKSSLVCAGLLPALRRQRDRFWDVLTLRPGPTPLRALAAAFNPRANDEGSAEYETKITNEADQLMAGDPDLLSHMISRSLDQAEGKPDRLLLYIDQWEELYTQAPASTDRERAAKHDTDVNRFIDLLLTAVRSAAPVTVVGTVRADFYDPLIGHEQIKALLPTCQVLLGKMLGSDLEQTIVEPAKKVGLTFNPPDLVQRILDEAGEDEGMLPLLQYALKETWNKREGNRLTGDSYTHSGGVREAIRNTAEQTFEALSTDDQRTARQLFLRLVTPGEGQEDTRARAAMPQEAAQRKIIDQFAGPRTRLLVTGSDRAGRPTVEVAHETLIRTWPRLREWINANRDKLRARSSVLQAKADWEQNGKRDDMLLPSGLQLERARSLLADPGDIATGDIKEFVSLSSARERAERVEREDALARDEARVAQIKAGQERTSRLQRITRWAFAAIGALILGTGATVGYLQRDTARRLGAQERALAESRVQLLKSQAEVAAEKASNDHAQAKILAEFSGTKLLHGELDSALRLALRGARIDLELPADVGKASPAAAELAALLSQIWQIALVGHDDAVWSAAFSPDGSRIVTASEDKTARIWDAATGKEIKVLRGHDGYVFSAGFSPDGSRIVTASQDQTARTWDTVTGKEIMVLRGHDSAVYSAVFSPDGSRIVTASPDATARIWDAVTGKEIKVLRGHENAVSSAAFNPDGSRIVTASWDATARIWDAVTGKEIKVLRGHVGDVFSAGFSPDGLRIVTASLDQTARIWDTATGKEIKVLRDASVVTSATFSPDGSRIVTASPNATARIWDAATGKEIKVLRGHNDSVKSAAFNRDGSRIVTASADKTARIWDAAATSKEIAVLRSHDNPGYGDSGPLTSDRVDSATFSPDGSRIVTTSNIGHIWDAATGKEIKVLRGHNDAMKSAVFSPHGSRIVTASWDGTASIWDAATGEEIKVLRGHASVVTSATFSPDGSRIVTASWDKTARIWDAATGKEIKVLRGHNDSVNSAAFSRDGSRIVTASADKTARTWDAATAEEIKVLRGHDRHVYSAVFNPDGSRIVTASQDQTARIWDAATAEEIKVLRSHDLVYSAAFSPDGSRIVTVSGGGAHIWDTATGKEIKVLGGYDTSSVDSATFSPDGSRIVTVSSDGAYIWDVHFQTMPVKDLLVEACGRMTGFTELTREEMRLASYPDSMPRIDVCQ